MIRITKNKNEYPTATLGIATILSLVIIWVFYYLWIQLGVNFFEELTTLNLFYAIVGVILMIAGIFAAFIHHYFAGTLLAIWGMGLVLIVLIYYTWLL